MTTSGERAPKKRSDRAPVEGGKLNRDVYSVKELATAVGVHFETVLDAIKKGELAAIKFGGSAGYRIRHQAAVEWLDALEHRHTEEARAGAA